MLEADLPGGGLRTFPTLRGSRGCDAVVVGGGIAGLMTACLLAEQGISVVLLEARRLGCGSSAACMGMAAADQYDAYRTAAAVSTEACVTWARMTLSALECLPALLGRWRIPCALRRERFVRYAVTSAEAERLRDWLALAGRLHLPVRETQDHGDCPVPVRCAAEMPEQLQFDAARFFSGLIDAAVRLGVSIYEQSAVRAIRRDDMLTEEGTVASPHVILATGWPVGMQDASQLNLLRQDAYLSVRMTGGMPCHASFQHDGRDGMRLMSSAYGLEVSCRLGAVGTKSSEKQIEASRRRIGLQLRDWSILHESVQPCVVSAAGLPLIGPLSRDNPRILALAGFGRNGVVQSYLAAELLVRHLMGRPEPDAALFHPCGAYHQQALRCVHPGENRLRAAAANLHHGRPYCPHMGSRMRWNEARMLWECPCHGSAFTPRGDCLTAPAIENASVPERFRRD